MFALMLALSLVAIGVSVLRLKERNASLVLEIILVNFLGIYFGIGSMLAGAFHIFYGPEIAGMIGWPPGSPFQFEVGIANLALGLICFLCLFFRGDFWLAAIISQSVFLFGCMVGHVISFKAKGNMADYNIGFGIIFSDVIFPLFVIGLYIAYQKINRSVGRT